MSRSGEYIKNMTGELAYNSFRPAPLPPDPILTIDDEMLTLLVEANRHLAQLDTVSRLVPNTDLFVSMYVRKEALITSQIEYYDRISEVRRNGNYEQWVLFFLEAVSAAASDAVDSIEKLSALHDENIAKLPQSTRSKDNVRLVFDYLEQFPIIDIGHTANALGLSYNTVSSVMKKLIELGIIQETTNAARNRVFAYEDYLKILRKDT